MTDNLVNYFRVPWLRKTDELTDSSPQIESGNLLRNLDYRRLMWCHRREPGPRAEAINCRVWDGKKKPRSFREKLAENVPAPEGVITHSGQWVISLEIFSPSITDFYERVSSHCWDVLGCCARMILQTIRQTQRPAPTCVQQMETSGPEDADGGPENVWHS